MSKRPRDDNDDNTDTSCSFLSCITDTHLLTHVLSYSYRSTYHLALVCKRFLGVTRSHAYWCALARRAFAHVLSPEKLLEVDFLHGLKPGEPPHKWLSALIVDNFKISTGHGKNKRAVVISMHGYDDTSTWRLVDHGFEHNPKAYTVHIIPDSYDSTEIIYKTHFHHSAKVKSVARYDGLKHIEIYAQFWNEDHTAMWYGMVDEQGKALEGFGTWVDKQDD